MLTPKEIECNTFEELYSAVDRIAGAEPYAWIFRGQRELSWRLQPRLERICCMADLNAEESAMMREFWNKAHLYTSHVPEYGNHEERLAVMQHHGVPTRLLDWTYSAFIALFFAVEHPSVVRHK